MAKLNYSVISYWNDNAALRGIRVQANLNFSGVPQARIYLDGGAVPGFSNMAFNSGDNYYFLQNMNLAPGLYVVDYNDSNGNKQLGKFYIDDSFDDSCYPELDSPSSLGTFFFRLTDVGLQLLTNLPIWLGHTVAEAQAIGASRSSIDLGTFWKENVYQGSSSMLTSVDWGNSEIFVSIIDEVRIKRNSNNCQDVIALELNVLNEAVPLEVNYAATNCTANGANDGTITLFPTGGSGVYTFTWSDGPVTQNRVGLASGFYTVVVTDVNTLEEVELEDIQITEPAPPEPEHGTLLEVPLLNSITFIVDPIDIDADGTDNATLDNVLFCQQYKMHNGFQRQEYFQKVCPGDNPILQFLSDFNNHTVQLKKLSDQTVVKNFPIELKEQNIDRQEEFNINIRNHTGFPGKSRVYFNTQTLPIPLSAGDFFSIFGNADGFNGNYTIVSIGFDVTLNSQYLVISLNYTAPFNTSPAEGKFYTSLVDFNVYEAVLDLNDVADYGLYYFYLKAYDDDGIGFKEAISEPILLKARHKGCTLIRYSNKDNANDMTWSTGYVGLIRVESNFGHKRIPGGVRSTSRDADYALTKINAKKTRGQRFESWQLTPYLHEKLSLIFDLDFFQINGVECQTDEDYAEPSYLFKSLLSNSSIKIEQKRWVRRYNSHDIGSAGLGFITNESGFIKR